MYRVWWMDLKSGYTNHYPVEFGEWALALLLDLNDACKGLPYLHWIAKVPE